MDSLITYIVYNSIIICPVLFVLFKRYNLTQSITYYFCLFFIVILASIREQVGRDFNNYVNIYYGLQDNERLEFGFQCLLDILNFFGLPSQSLFFFSALIIYWLIFKSYKSLSSYIFICLWLLIFFLPSLNVIRQSISIAILTYGLLYLDNKKKFIFFIVLATSFHYTGAVGILFLISSRINLKFLWIALLFSPIAVFIKLADILLYLGIFENSYYYFYLVDEEIYAGQQTLSIGGIIRLTIVYLFIYIYRDDSRYFISFLKNSLFIYCILYFLSLNFYILYRVYMPFAIALPFAAYYLFKEKGVFTKCFTIFYILCLFIFFQKNISEQTISPGQGNAVYPYQTIFSDKIIELD